MQSSSPLRVIILAAGHGTRLKSKTPKVLHKVGGSPLLGHVIRVAQHLKPVQIVVVTSPTLPQVGDYVEKNFPEVLQAPQEKAMGTGHAVLCARPFLSGEEGETLVLYGDAPLVQSQTLERLLTLKECFQAQIGVLGMESADKESYGRLVTRKKGSPEESQELEKIVELADATPAEKLITLCNSGILWGETHLLFSLLEKVQPSDQTGEYYLTEVIRLAREENRSCWTVKGPEEELIGINTRAELAVAEKRLQERYRRQALEAGVTLQDPETTFFSFDTQVSKDVTIGSHVVFGTGVILEEGCTLLPFTHLEETHVGEGVSVGPFARLRGRTYLSPRSEVGNFVELKNTTLGVGTKAKHLSYLGDATIGEKTNIGAGVITANYDGFNKWKTRIGGHVMVGVHSTLIAPLHIEDGAMIGAGSVITKDVNRDDLALNRGHQKNFEKKALLLREKYKRLKEK